MTERVEAVVIGAGVVGLACARALARAGKEVLILERHLDIGTETSSRNSEVIHAGIYYPQGSHKAGLCVGGRDQLYAFCADHGVAHQRCGKLIVATSSTQTERLHSIRAQAALNGVDDLQLLSAEEAQEMEPELSCSGALLSPSTGIIDSHELMLALLGDAEKYGAVLATSSSVLSARVVEDGLVLRVEGDAPIDLHSGIVVNSAGLEATALAASISGLNPGKIPDAYLAKGNYFALSGRAPFSRLIYPVPEPGGLGVHLTLDMAGQARFGPDVEWLEQVDYSVDPKRSGAFYQAIRRYWPDLPDDSLQPAYSGIRPKLVGPDEGDSDFQIQGPDVHGIAGLVNLFGIESPGLTSCLAIGDVVCAAIE